MSDHRRGAVAGSTPVQPRTRAAGTMISRRSGGRRRPPFDRAGGEPTGRRGMTSEIQGLAAPSEDHSLPAPRPPRTVPRPGASAARSTRVAPSVASKHEDSHAMDVRSPSAPASSDRGRDRRGPHSRSADASPRSAASPATPSAGSGSSRTSARPSAASWGSSASPTTWSSPSSSPATTSRRPSTRSSAASARSRSARRSSSSTTARSTEPATSSARWTAATAT